MTQHQFTGVTILLIGLLFGLARSDYMVSGQCSQDTGQINAASIADGNCTPMGLVFNYGWELITTSTGGEVAYINYCQDSACQKCLPIMQYPVTPFVDCNTTPTFRYTTKNDPESEVTNMMGGTVFISGDTYDNCTTVLKKSFTLANVCLSSPTYHISQIISCEAGDQWGTFWNYSDDNCQTHSDKEPVWTGGCRAGEKYFNYCLTATGSSVSQQY